MNSVTLLLEILGEVAYLNISFSLLRQEVATYAELLAVHRVLIFAIYGIILM